MEVEEEAPKVEKIKQAFFLKENLSDEEFKETSGDVIKEGKTSFLLLEDLSDDENSTTNLFVERTLKLPENNPRKPKKNVEGKLKLPESNLRTPKKNVGGTSVTTKPKSQAKTKVAKEKKQFINDKGSNSEIEIDIEAVDDLIYGVEKKARYTILKDSKKSFLKELSKWDFTVVDSYKNDCSSFLKKENGNVTCSKNLKGGDFILLKGKFSRTI